VWWPRARRGRRGRRVIGTRSDPAIVTSPKSSRASLARDVRTRKRAERFSRGRPVSASRTGCRTKSGNALQRPLHGSEPAGGAAVSPPEARSPPDSASSEMFTFAFGFAEPSREMRTRPVRGAGSSSRTVTAPTNRMTAPVSFSRSRRNSGPRSSDRTTGPSGRGSTATAKSSEPCLTRCTPRSFIHGRGASPDGGGGDAPRRAARSRARLASAASRRSIAASTRRVPSWPATTRREA
jgi:hypothetical protein